jgi:hypothetical protein
MPILSILINIIYSSSADPVGSGFTPVVPYGEFLAAHHCKGSKTEIISFDKSDEFETKWPATSPTLLSSFIRILQSNNQPPFLSLLYYYLRAIMQG